MPGDDERWATTFDARVWLAHLLGCPTGELHRVGLVERSPDGTSRTVYRGRAVTARISIGPPWRTLLGEDRRLVLAQWGETGSRATDIAVDAQVRW